RTRNANKRGSGAAHIPFDEVTAMAAKRPSAMIAIDDALAELARKDPVKAQLVEMRFFGGMTAEDSAQVLNITTAEVRRHLRVGQAWLQRELDQKAAPEKKS